jgi:hypothetical protein
MNRTALDAVRSRCLKSGDWELILQVLLTGEASPANDAAQDAYSRLRRGVREYSEESIDWKVLERVVRRKTSSKLSNLWHDLFGT